MLERFPCYLFHWGRLSLYSYSINETISSLFKVWPPYSRKDRKAWFPLDRNRIVKSRDSSRLWLIVERLIATEKKALPKSLQLYSPRDFCYNFLQTFVQGAKTCLDRTISRSRCDLIETRHEHVLATMSEGAYYSCRLQKSLVRDCYYQKHALPCEKTVS